jgi:murein lipoprotein
LLIKHIKIIDLLFFNVIDERNWQRRILNEENINNCLIYEILLTLIFSKGKCMKKIIKLSMLTLAFSMIAACSTTGNIQSQIDDLNSKISQISSDAASAQASAAEATASAEAAEAAANRAAQYAQDSNRKLDRGYIRPMVE